MDCSNKKILQNLENWERIYKNFIINYSIYESIGIRICVLGDDTGHAGKICSRSA